MPACRQGSARPDQDSSPTQDDTPTGSSGALCLNAQAADPRSAVVLVLGSCAPKNAEHAHRERQLLAALDRVLFVGPFVLIGSDNKSPARVDDLGQARDALARNEAATVGGTLRRAVLAADIDPAAVDAVLGDVVAEQLVAWCAANELPYFVRESGRPGGRHVFTVTSSPTLAVEWAHVCAELVARHGVPIDDRTGKVLRLLSAPHRTGRPAPALGGTLTPAAVLDAVEATDQALSSRRQTGRRRNPTTPRQPGDRDRSRSGREYGQACAMVRAGYTPARAWTIQNQPGSKTRERGELNWRRYIWLPAVTTVAAEEGTTEDEAWQRAQLACRSRCRKLGLDWWRVLWRRAQHEATQDRPRRYRVDDTEPAPGRPQLAAEIGTARGGLLAAADELLSSDGARPQRRHSAAALLHALAPVLLGDRAGSISVRDLAELAHLDPKTVRATRNALVSLAVLAVVHQYEGGAEDCHRYAVGPAAQSYIEAAQRAATETSPTSCSAPPPAPTGHANVTQLRTRHAADRQVWRLRCTLSAVTETTGETYAESQHPAAKTLRSLHYQRQWWRSLSPEQQEQRRAERRRLLGQLDPVGLSAWLDWLARRELIRVAADHIAAGTAVSADHDAVTLAPLTVHRGMRDPQWRTGGTPSVPPGEQLRMVA